MKRFTVLLISPILLAQSADNCSFKADPDAYLNRAKRARDEVSSRSMAFSMSRGAEAGAVSRLVDPNSIPRQNFIDEAVFSKMAKAGVKSAPISTDAEFVRRIYLDLTGRIPSAAQVRSFLEDRDTGKRSRLIGELLHSDAFTDKWTWWMDEWVGNRSNSPTGAYRTQNTTGRNAQHKFNMVGVQTGRPLRDMAIEYLSSTGNNYDEGTGATNFMISSWTFGGPNEDSYDTMALRSANVFMGIQHYDCLMCHGGKYHLEPINLWASKVTRLQAQQMSAYFSRGIQTQFVLPAGLTQEERNAHPYNNSFLLTDVTNRSYSLRTTFGNRPNRTPIGTQTTLTPEWSFSHGAKPTTNNWREEYAKNLVEEPMFARNLANRLWKQVFNLGLVDPVDTMDPARLDPKNPPGEGWALQATHPQLLEDLATWIRENDFNLRSYLRLLTESSAYQLSSEYPGAAFTPEMVPLFARHYVRRLEAEEIHDAITRATGVVPNYRVPGWGDPMNWALQLPDMNEPSSDGGARNFMATFGRGNRENQPRTQVSSTLQQLALMNDTFVTNRITMAQSNTLKEIVKLTDNGAAVDEIFLTFLSRTPNESEKAKAVAHLAKATNATLRNTYLEDLAWSLINKIDFLFSY
jgi:hypothetical protein